MIKPHLWSKSINCVSDVYWRLECLKNGKRRHELPVMARLNGVSVNINRLREELAIFARDKIWDGLGSDYAHMCETHTNLPKMFFKEEELEGVECVCDLDWEHSSYQQLSLTEFDESYDLTQRTEKSGSAWRHASC